MKPNFALDLSPEGIRLLHRTGIGWMCVGDVSLDDPALGDQLAVLRRTATGLENSGVATKLVIPNSQILYTEVHAPGPNDSDRIEQIRDSLEGKTPYDIDDLVFDWRDDGQSVKVAVVYRQSLKEAEGFAVQHGFNPVSFVATPVNDSFDGEPFFGPTTHSTSILSNGDAVEPDGEPMVVFGTDRPLEETGKHSLDSSGLDQQQEALFSTPLSADPPKPPKRSQKPVKTGPGPGPAKGGRGVITAYQPLPDESDTEEVPSVLQDQIPDRGPVTSSSIVDSSELRKPTVAKERTGRGSAPNPEDSHQTASSGQAGEQGDADPASSDLSLREDLFDDSILYPNGRSRGQRIMIILLTLALIVTVCVGLLLWLSPDRIESTSIQTPPVGESLSTVADGSVATQNDSEALQNPNAATPVKDTAGSSLEQMEAKVPTAEVQQGFPDASGSPPPDRILLPPPSRSESERTYIATGVWPLDPDQPGRIAAERHDGDIYVAKADRVFAPPVPTTPITGLQAAEPTLPLASSPKIVEEPDVYWSSVNDDLPAGTPIHHPSSATLLATVTDVDGVAGAVLSATQDSINADGDSQSLSRGTDSAEEASGESPTLGQESSENVSSLAVSVSLRPSVRPERRLPAARPAQSAAESGSEANTSRRQNGNTAAGPADVSVAGLATQRDVIETGRINLIGTFGSTSDRRALVQLRSGRFRRNIEVGDRLDGGRVTAIGASELLYEKNGESIRLTLPAN